MKKPLIKIIIGILLIIWGCQIAEWGNHLTSKEELKQMMNFCTQADTTKGYLKDSIVTIRVKIKVDITLYECYYDFKVNGKDYSSRQFEDNKPSKDSVTVWYNKNNPAENDISNPCIAYEKTKKEKVIGTKSYYYIGGIAFIIFGFYLSWGTLKHLFKTWFWNNVRKKDSMTE